MKSIFALVLVFSLSLLITGRCLAYDPTSVPNNKFGIHILTTDELQEAAKLVDSSGGQWGYVTIPIQAGDKDLVKWQKFMDLAKSLHLIPIIRLATEGDFFNTASWRKPDASDILDFSNFLDSLSWPTKNRYIVVFNEVNRADEWGGSPNASEYADLLSFAVTAFKSKNPDFFIISAGMDNASVNSGPDENEYTYFSQMNEKVPGIFNQIDGIASHSYPNPGFSMPSSFLSTKTIDTFYYEERYIEGLASKKFPVFITETGWNADIIPKSQVASFYNNAFSGVWNDPSVVAVTPFLLKAGSEPFSKFSFMNQDGSPSEIYKSYSDIKKVSGKPILTPDRKVLSDNTSKKLPVVNFSKSNEKSNSKFNKFETLVKMFFRF